MLRNRGCFLRDGGACYVIGFVYFWLLHNKGSLGFLWLQCNRVCFLQNADVCYIIGYCLLKQMNVGVC